MYAEKAGPLKELSILQDVSKRPSKCRVCNLTMPSGSRRMVMSMRHGYQPFPNGGGTNSTKVFFHPSCFVQTDDSCTNCGTEDYAKVDRNTCILCFIENDARRCQTCYTLGSASEMLSDVLFPENKYCKGCIKHYSIQTREQRDKEETDAQKAEAKMRTLISGAAKWQE